MRAKILGAVDIQYLCQPRACPIDARFYGTYCATADARCLLIGKSRRAYQDQGLARIGRQLRKGLAKFPELNVAILVRLRFKRLCVMAISVFDLAPAFAIFGAKMIAQNGEEPR